MTEYVDWPTTRPNGTSAGLAVVLPGRNYPATMPLLTFAGRAAAQHGWQVRAVSWVVPELDTPATIDWVGDQLRMAVGDHAGPVLVIGKSLGSMAAVHAARHGWDAVWLTPLLLLPEVVRSMELSTGRQLLVGGGDDPAWDLETARGISSDVLHVEGADHGMFLDDAVRTAEIHVDVTRAIDRWLGAA